MEAREKSVEPEQRMERRLKPLRLKEADVYDVLAYLIRRHGIGPVVEQLKNFFWDKTDEAFGGVCQDRSDYSFTGLNWARAWDVCGALLECLEGKIREFEMSEKGLKRRKGNERSR